MESFPCINTVGRLMTDEEILGIFSRNGMRIELGAQFSAKGQIAQLLNGCKEFAEYINPIASQLSLKHKHFRCPDCDGNFKHSVGCPRCTA